MSAGVLEEMTEEGFHSEKGKGIPFLFFLVISRFIFEYFLCLQKQQSLGIHLYQGWRWVVRENVPRAIPLTII